MVARSYQNLEILDEPHAVSGKPAKYVTVLLKSGQKKEVRWYTEREYSKMYPDAVPTVERATQKEILGFENGYITIFKGNTWDNLEYFKASAARYCTLWGWYFISTMPLPDDLPADVEPVCLPWESVGTEDGQLKSEKAIAEVINNLIYEPSGEYAGEIGDKVAVTVRVDKAIPLESNYGVSTMYIMSGTDGRCYVWITTVRFWDEGSVHSITGVIKDLRVYQGVKQTILTRCRSKD